MKGVELYRQVRHSVRIEGLSRREAARRFGLDPRTVAKMLAFSVPPGYRRSRPPARPKLDPFVGIIDQMHRTLRVARTLADLDGSDSVRRLHIAEALSYRRPQPRAAMAA